ncbi:MAG TPA: peptidoglycan editing factor PgeF [Casimicrobiaceae bacterium]|nr:peptidoglycan editing factor PgeF [Casimicrobiaceae bacterium]
MSDLSAQLRAAGLDWIVPDWAAPAGVHALFTTRNGGRVQAFLPSPPVWLDQVHGTEVVDVDADATHGRALPRADAAVTRAPGVVLAVRVADCLPVFLCDRAGTAIGVAHAGWRGLAAGVIENTVAAMACEPAGITAWLGPAIGPSAFEVGPDVRDAFVATDDAAARAFVPVRTGKWLADLHALACQRLARAGVEQISAMRACTFSEAQRFFSYRRDGATGRMGAFVWRTAA